jgi:hypothetical protein
LFAPSCFSGTLSGDSVTDLSSNLDDDSDGDAYQYRFDFSWGNPTRCSRINMIATFAESEATGGDGVETQDIDTIIAGYPYNPDQLCEAGARCTIISVRGYNRRCGDVGVAGTVEREVLLQF